MDKLLNSSANFDNARRVIAPEEYTYFDVQPFAYAPLDCIDDDTDTAVVRFKCEEEDPLFEYIDLPCTTKVRQMFATKSHVVVVTHNNELLFMYEHLPAFEKISVNISYVVPNESMWLCCVTTQNKCAFINMCSGMAAECTIPSEVERVYAVKDKFYIVTTLRDLHCFGSTLQTFHELCGIVSDVFVTLYAIAVLTTDRRVWVYGENKCISFIADGRGFIAGLDSGPVQVRLTLNAGAILLENGNVWAWGSTLFGGSPKPGYVRGMPICQAITTTANSALAVTFSDELWAWSNAWFKTYDLQYSTYATGDRLSNIYVQAICENHIGWMVDHLASPLRTMITNDIYTIPPMANAKITTMPLAFIFETKDSLRIYKAFSRKPYVFTDVSYWSHSKYGIIIETATGTQSATTVTYIQTYLQFGTIYTIKLLPDDRVKTTHISDDGSRFIIVTTCGRVYVNTAMMPCTSTITALTDIVDICTTLKHVVVLTKSVSEP